MPTASPTVAHFVFVIGSTDDFDSVNDLHIAAEARANKCFSEEDEHQCLP